MEQTETDRSTFKLYTITVKRVFTEDYCNKYNAGNPRETVSSYNTWGADFDTVNEVVKRHDEYPTKYASFDKMYRESLVSVEEVTPEELENKRNWAQRYPRCCELGIQVNCVCSYSISCPVHGTKCTGTHD